jgi:hypothetical protein
MTFLDVDVAALKRALHQRVVVFDELGAEDGILRVVEDEGITIEAGTARYAYDWAEIHRIFIVERRITPKGAK